MATSPYNIYLYEIDLLCITFSDSNVSMKYLFTVKLVKFLF